MKKIIDKIIIIFLFIQPLLDVLTSIQIRYNFLSIYISSIIRVVFMLFVLIYMIIYKYDLKIIILLFIYGLIELGYLYFGSSLSLLFNVIRIFYLPVMILFFSKYDININKKYILIIYLMYLLLLLIPTVCGFSFDIYTGADDKKGFIGLFYGGNELSGILLGMLPIILIYLKDIKKIYLRVIYYVLIVATFILVSTKTLFLGGILVLLVFLYRYIKNKRIKNKKGIILSIVGVLLLVLIILPYTPVMNNIKITLNYYGINEPKDVFSLYALDNVVFSRRLSYADNLFNEYSNSSIQNRLLGLPTVNTIKDSEIDLVDIFVTIGLIGLIIYVFIMTYLIRHEKMKFEYKLSLILFIVMSLFSGHILIKPAVSIYMGLIYNLNKEESK